MFKQNDSRRLAALYIRVSGYADLVVAQDALHDLAEDLGLGVFKIYLDLDCENVSSRNSGLGQLLTDGRNNCFGIVIRLSSTYRTFDRDFLEHSFGLLAAEGIRLITLGGQYGDEAFGD